MADQVSKHTIRTSRVTALVTILFIFSAAGCRWAQKNTKTGAQTTFATPQEAEAAFLAAAKSGDQNAVIAIFGPDSKTVLFTGDAATDQARLNQFVTAYNQMHRWARLNAGGQVLSVGADNHIFPIPLGQNSSGRWYFDTAAGKDEILARRIGKNELTAMDASQALAGAEHQYYQERHGNGGNQYAQKFISDPGKQDGLYWPVQKGKPPSPLGRLGDFAQANSTNDANSADFNGYRYRILSKAGTPQGAKDYMVDGKLTGFAILAYPVEYRNSGIASFLIGDDGTLYQKDLGERTPEVAAAITEYNPADGWKPASTSSSSASRSQ